jgi:hypothetical protein
MTQVKYHIELVSKAAGDRAPSHPVHPQYLAVAQADLSTNVPKVAANAAAKHVPSFAWK